MRKYLFALLLLLAFRPAMAQKASLNHIALWVVDLKTSTQFYQQIIGLDTIPEPFHDGKHTWFSIGPKSHLHLIQGAPMADDHPKNSHLCFTVASVADFIKVLVQKNIPFENWLGDKNAVTTRVDGVKQIYFKDPDGYWIEVNDAGE
ncbi:MAG: VOC family protein [Bacteroidetes bacterium]|nr:VOC family protein [Bacteroidota bacterium]